MEECTSVDRFNAIPHAMTGETSLCFMIGKDFVPDGLRVSHTVSTPDHYVYSARDGDYWFNAAHRHHIGHCASIDHGTHHHSYNSGIRNTHDCYDSHYNQVIPFHDDSIFCFDLNFERCNTDNIQYIDGVSTTAPEPGPTQPLSGAALLHTIYNNHTGALTLVFDSMVIASNPDRIQLIHDIDVFLEDTDSAPDLGDSELHTVDNKRQSMILAFALDGEIRAAVAESLRMHGDLALVIGERAVYSSDGFVDVTDGSPLLVTDILVVR